MWHGRGCQCSTNPVKNCPDCPNCPPGSFDVAVTPDGQYAFVANEYGTLPSPTPATVIGGGQSASSRFNATVPVDLNGVEQGQSRETVPYTYRAVTLFPE